MLSVCMSHTAPAAMLRVLREMLSKLSVCVSPTDLLRNLMDFCLWRLSGLRMLGVKRPGLTTGSGLVVWGDALKRRSLPDTGPVRDQCGTLVAKAND